MGSYVVTGSSRGLGLELVKNIASTASTRVFATARGQSPSTALAELIKSSIGRVHYVQLDLNNTDSIHAAVEHISKETGKEGIDALINSAGTQFKEPGGTRAMDHLEETLSTNVVAIHKTTQAFLPLLQQGRQKRIINIGSTMGSMGLNPYIAFISTIPSYKISKAALNALTIQWANDLEKEGFVVVSISPGRLNTGLGGVDNSDADLSAAEGAAAVLKIVHDLKPEDNGTFRNIHVPGMDMYDGKNPPW